MRLDAFAERFAQAGIAALAFTYRHFGDSGGHVSVDPTTQQSESSSMAGCTPATSTQSAT
jgi:hypothetical protein